MDTVVAEKKKIVEELKKKKKNMVFMYCHKKMSRDFPGGLLVKTPCS